jgi:uncharacterized protein (TIGR03083 family)
MNPVRAAMLDAVRGARGLLARPEVAAAWQEPSALAAWTVSGLAGHLVRGCVVVLEYLQAPLPEGEPIAAPAYYPSVMDSTTDIDSPVNVQVRLRGDAWGEAGQRGLVARLDEELPALAAALESEPGERRLAVFGRAMRLDDYLKTRIVEVLVHCDDLAVSVGVPYEPPPTASDVAFDYLLAVARHVHGYVAVLRGFTRRERDRAEALRVF